VPLTGEWRTRRPHDPIISGPRREALAERVAVINAGRIPPRGAPESLAAATCGESTIRFPAAGKVRRRRFRHGERL